MNYLCKDIKILWKTAKRQTYMIAFIIVVIIGILFYDVETQKRCK